MRRMPPLRVAVAVAPLVADGVVQPAQRGQDAGSPARERLSFSRLRIGSSRQRRWKGSARRHALGPSGDLTRQNSQRGSQRAAMVRGATASFCDNWPACAATTRRRTFGDLLRDHRRAAGLTQEELAERAGVSPRSISELERGGAHVPRRDTVALLARALGLEGPEREAFEAPGRRRGRPLGQRVDADAPTRAASHNLPRALTSFVGREPELDRAGAVLAAGAIAHAGRRRRRGQDAPGARAGAAHAPKLRRRRAGWSSLRRLADRVDWCRRRGGRRGRLATISRRAT